MAQIKSITVDNGGSEIRTVWNSNSEEKIVNTMDKQIGVVLEKDFRIKDNVQPLDVIRILKAPIKDIAALYVRGSAYFMYNNSDLVMNNQQQKSSTTSWYQQIIIAIAVATAYEIVQGVSIRRGMIEEIKEKINEKIDFYLTTLIPVHEHSGNEDCAQMLKDKFAGDYEVEFPLMSEEEDKFILKFNLASERIGVLPEGVVAMTRLARELTSNENTLIIDLGHISTDLAICKGVSLIGSSVITSPFAGSTLLKIISSILHSHNVLASEESALELLMTGKLKVGRHEIDVMDEVDICKKQFVQKYIREAVLSEIETAGLLASSIHNVVPIGAIFGLKHPKTKQCDILDMIIEECSLKKAEIKQLSGDLRHVNILAASEFSEALMSRV